MTILTIYVLKKFLRPFLASFTTLCIVVFISQLLERLDRFMAHGVSLSHVAGYLFTSLPYQTIQLLPVACLLGTLFVIGDLARNREYVAGLAGGIPPEKFLGGILLAGLSISFLSLLINETIVPPTSRYSARVFREKIKHYGEWRQTLYTDLFVAGAEGRMWSCKRFDLNAETIDRVVVDSFQAGILTEQIDAMKATWNPNGWTFSNGVHRTFGKNGLEISQASNFPELILGYVEKPWDLVTQEPEPAEMNYKTLKKHIRRLESLGVESRKLEVELMMKLALPFTCFIVTCLGVPLAMKGKGNRAKGIASAGALTLVYMGFIQFGKAMAQRVITPFVGAWMGNVVFLVVALFLWVRMRRTA